VNTAGLFTSSFNGVISTDYSNIILLAILMIWDKAVLMILDKAIFAPSEKTLPFGKNMLECSCGNEKTAVFDMLCRIFGKGYGLA